MKTYSELIKLKTFKERFEYLKLNGCVGEDTFGWNRYLNQTFYKSPEWRKVRNEVIIRDNGCDLGLLDYPINNRIISKNGKELKKGTGPIIHHMNPINEKDILDRVERLLNPDELITVSLSTHNAIHYGSYDLIDFTLFATREKGDTKLW